MTDIIKLIEEKEKLEKKNMKDYLLEVFDIVSFLVFVGGIVLFIRFFIFNPFTVVGQSMEPTFEGNDFIIVDKVTQRFGDFKRGDVIVFVPPGKDVPYIKRIIGLPGEIVKLIDGSVFICNKDTNGESCKALDEPYIREGLKTQPTCNVKEFVVTKGGYFVLGDNRDHSTDSRCCFGVGCYNGSNYLVPSDYVIGKVYVRILPNFKKF